MHDAANVLRRYFNQLPEPIIPLDFYEQFRDPLRNHQAQAVGAIEGQGPELGTFDAEVAIRAYQGLITELPPLNRQLLLYILDLLAVFASKSDLNKMTTTNLAAIFQPGILSHPQHDMAPKEYRLSQDVLIFLIENQDSFLIGMQGTAADEKTVKEVQSGAPTPRTPSTPTTPGRSKTLIGRSISNASAGADSVRKWGNIRRNVSVSSRASKVSVVGPSPVTPSLNSPTIGGSGLNRSNTVPSKRSAQNSPRFMREKSSDPPTPSPVLPPSPGLPPTVNTNVQARGSQDATPIATRPPSDLAPVAPPEVISASSSEATTPLAAPPSDTSALLCKEPQQTPQRDQLTVVAPSSIGRDASADRSASGTPGSSRAFLDIFKQSPTDDGQRREGRRPNKLQKKRIPGSALSSAQSSAQDLQAERDDDLRNYEYGISPVTPTFDHHTNGHVDDYMHDHSAYATAQTSPRQTTPQRMPTDATLRPSVSPAQSYHSHTSVTDASDADYGNEAPSTAEKPEKKRRWRFSHSAKKGEQDQTTPTQTPSNIGTLAGADRSKSTISSAGASRPRQSFQDTPTQPQQGYGERSASSATAGEQVLSDSEERKKAKGAMSWIRGKIQERKERDAERRARTPPRNKEWSSSRQDLTLPEGAGRGKSMDVPRSDPAAPAGPVGQRAEEKAETQTPARESEKPAQLSATHA